ncbi:MAG: HEAT repeat domain-containing protein [Planctomycetes bacterium]|nr:HEAT repeat domain-containing protein [Planctomycetota bacterium]
MSCFLPLAWLLNPSVSPIVRSTALAVSMGAAWPHTGLPNPAAGFTIGALQAPEAKQQPEDKKAPSKPSPERVAECVKQIESALKSREAADRAAPLAGAATVVDPKVAAAVARALQDKEVAVRIAAIDALGRMEHRSALEELHRYYQSNKHALHEEEKVFPELLRAIGRHGHESSVAILSDDPFGQKYHKAIEARIYALGNIRSVKAVEALLDLMKIAGNGKTQPYMAELRLSLQHLTGEDRGPTRAEWIRWWNDHKSGYALPKSAPELKGPSAKKWQRFWDAGAEKSAEEAPRTGRERQPQKPGEGKRPEGGSPEEKPPL